MLSGKIEKFVVQVAGGKQEKSKTTKKMSTSSGDTTEKVRYELYDKSKLIVDGCSYLVKSMLQGSMHDEYILKTARNFAVKESHITRTNQEIHQLEFLHQELLGTHYSTQKHLETIQQANAMSKVTLARLNSRFEHLMPPATSK